MMMIVSLIEFGLQMGVLVCIVFGCFAWAVPICIIETPDAKLKLERGQGNKFKILTVRIHLNKAPTNVKIVRLFQSFVENVKMDTGVSDVDSPARAPTIAHYSKLYQFSDSSEYDSMMSLLSLLAAEMQAQGIPATPLLLSDKLTPGGAEGIFLCKGPVWSFFAYAFCLFLSGLVLEWLH